MKKKLVLLGLGVVGVCLLIALFGNKTMTCTVTSAFDENTTYETVINIKYKNDKIKSMKATFTFDKEEQATQLYEVAKNNNIDGMKISQKGNKFVIKNYEKLINEGLEKELTKKEMIEQFEYMEYECK